MCGIYGFVGKAKDPKKVFKLMKSLAIVSEVRGIDGTGFFALHDDELIMEKTNSRAKTFVKKSKHMYDAIVKHKSTLFVGHNRMASVGDKNNIDNAHPLCGDKIIMVHNGTTHDALKMIESEGLVEHRNGETDSDAIRILFEHKGVKETLPKLRNYSVVAFDYTEGNLYFARDVHKPMFVYDFRKTLGVRIFASTKAIVESALKYCKINSKGSKSFGTQPYHLYSVNLEDGEFTNEGRYKSITTRDLSDRKQRELERHNWYKSQTEFCFGRRGYAAPRLTEVEKKKSYTLGWSGRLPEGVKN